MGKFNRLNISPENSFDDIVIGSSPLMLLQAGMLARDGRRVCLVEREGSLGGSWRIAELDNGERVEIACHLIEFYPGIYEFLEGASGVPFEALAAQPIRIHRSGMILPYFSRILMLLSGVRLILGFIAAKIDITIGRAKDRNRLINFQKKLSSYVMYQGPAFFQRPVMRGPKYGFVDFMDRLVKRSKSDGVEINQFDVLTMKRGCDNRWCLTDRNGAGFSAEHVHCTTSANLRFITAGHFEAQPQEFINRLTLVVEVLKEDVKISQTYVGFWADPMIIRVSRVDMPEQQSCERYLVEFRADEVMSQVDWHFEINERMRRAKIIDRDGICKVLGRVDCQFTTNVSQLPAGEIDANLWGYYSMGNLAAGLAAWRDSRRIPPLAKQIPVRTIKTTD